MKKKLIFSLVALILLAFPFASAAAIHGTVYDLELNELKNAVVEINTQPAQKVLAKDGTYSFAVQNGNYTIKARWNDIATEEQIIVGNDGDFVFDLFLIPNLEGDGLENDIDFGVLEERSGKVWLVISIVAGILLVVGGFIYLLLKKKKAQREEQKTAIEQPPEMIMLIVETLQKNEGRMTQKDLRKELPQLTEAKISLGLTELEAKGKVERIKKGRGNVVIWKGG